MKKKFCENCGNKLSKSAKFCGNCGAVIEELSEVLEAVTSKTESKNKTEKNWKQKLRNGIIAGVAVTALLWAFDTLSPEYPKSKEEFAGLYCGKCWHLTNVDIEGIYFNGELISFDKDNENLDLKALREEMENKFQEYISDKGGFQIAKVASDGEIIIYDQYFDDSYNEHVFTTCIPKLSTIDGKFNIIIEGTKYIYSVKSGERVDTDFSTDKMTSTIEKITAEKLDVLTRYEIDIDDINIVMMLRMNNEPITPTVQSRYESEFAIWDQQ